MPSPLTPCPGCRRHVRFGESNCPFCAADLSTVAAPPAVSPPALRVGRAALFVFASAVATASCSSSTMPAGDGNGAADAAGDQQDAPDTGGIAPAYGVPFDDGGGGLRYGAPPPTDS